MDEKPTGTKDLEPAYNEKGDAFEAESGEGIGEFLELHPDGDEAEILTDEAQGVFSYLDLIHSTIPELDDLNMPLFTFRTVILGLETSSCDHLSPLHPYYRLHPWQCNKVIPKSRFFNPGPFTIKEHVVISMTATSAAASAFLFASLATNEFDDYTVPTRVNHSREAIVVQLYTHWFGT
ncbi:hypothetical protein BZG36_04821 [Bifiguratus adelaidae]|uniref:Uncharacterized protein n=1 Tax=Bifiguratus adelaidae TaxID=1938954 RepID=A0A261XV99_9FUNG|nr:hypothetical protein BZG36_04821 [Bifiguratus adelaidae]